MINNNEISVKLLKAGSSGEFTTYSVDKQIFDKLLEKIIKQMRLKDNG